MTRTNWTAEMHIKARPSFLSTHQLLIKPSISIQTLHIPTHASSPSQQRNCKILKFQSPRHTYRTEKWSPQSSFSSHPWSASAPPRPSTWAEILHCPFSRPAKTWHGRSKSTKAVCDAREHATRTAVAGRRNVREEFGTDPSAPTRAEIFAKDARCSSTTTTAATTTASLISWQAPILRVARSHCWKWRGWRALERNALKDALEIIGSVVRTWLSNQRYMTLGEEPGSDGLMGALEWMNCIPPGRIRSTRYLFPF